MATQKITNSITADGTYTFDISTSNLYIWASGSFGGGTLKFQDGFDGINYLDMTGAVLTQSTSIGLFTGATHGQMVMAGSTNPNIAIYITNIG